MYVPPWLDQKKNTLLSGNAGDDKNLHPGLLNWFSRRYSLLFFSFSCFFVFLLLLFFCLFVCLLFVCLFFKIWNIYSDTHSTTRLGEWQKSFDLADFRNKNFLALGKVFRFTMFWLLEMHLGISPPLLHDLIISPPWRTTPSKVGQKKFVSWKSLSHTLEGEALWSTF